MTREPMTTDLRASSASLALDLIRLVAAQAVVVGHAIAFFGVAKALQPPNSVYLQNVAVQVFFVLSGFVIAHTLATKSRRETYGFAEYFIDRFARIYSAYVPALLAIVAIDFTVILAGSYDHPEYLTPKVFLANVVMLQNWPGPYLVMPSLGSAGPLWTLAIEWHIYMFVGALFFITRAPWLVIVAVPFAIVPLTFLTGSAQPDVGTALFALWLYGFAGYYLIGQLKRFGAWALGAITILALSAYLLVLTPGEEYVPLAYPLLAIGFLAAIALATRYAAPARGRAVRFIGLGAGFSFSLYLVHYTVLYALKRFWDGDAYLGALVGFVAANALALLIALPTEMRHLEFAAALKSRLLRRTV
jgi:peptidoglycan/LPS O-acetylase OafA/YrhL